MKVLLTGADGLVGMALRTMLARRGHNVVACDITAFGRTDPEFESAGGTTSESVGLKSLSVPELTPFV